MGEKYRGEGWYSESSYREKDPDVEVREHLDEIDRLLARLIEKGGDLPGDIRKAIRQQIQVHVDALGLKSLEDYEGLVAIQQRLGERQRNIPTPTDYPNKGEFQEKLAQLYQARAHEGMLPRVPQRPSALDVARYGQGDWGQLEGRSRKSAVDYLYDLGKVMSSELAYTSVFDMTDAIEVGTKWGVENGRHRSLVLRVLGAEYVTRKGMDRWIVV